MFEKMRDFLSSRLEPKEEELLKDCKTMGVKPKEGEKLCSGGIIKKATVINDARGERAVLTTTFCPRCPAGREAAKFGGKQK